MKRFYYFKHFCFSVDSSSLLILKACNWVYLWFIYEVKKATKIKLKYIRLTLVIYSVSFYWYYRRPLEWNQNTMNLSFFFLFFLLLTLSQTQYLLFANSFCDLLFHGTLGLRWRQSHYAFKHWSRGANFLGFPIFCHADKNTIVWQKVLCSWILILC